MMSMSGIISIRASWFSGSFEPSLTGMAIKLEQLGSIRAAGAGQRIRGPGRHRLDARKFIQVMPMMLGRFHDQFDVIDRSFEPRAQMGEATIQEIIGQQAENRDPQPTRGGDQRFGKVAAARHAAIERENCASRCDVPATRWAQ